MTSAPTGPKEEVDHRAFYETSPCGYLTLAWDLTVLASNQTLRRWTGHAEDAAWHLRDALTPASWTVFSIQCMPALHMQGRINEVALDLRRGDGSVMPVLGAFQRVERDAGRQPLIRVILFDATERRLYERELLQARRQAEETGERLTTILEATTDGVLLAGQDWRLSYANPTALRLLPSAVPGADLRAIFATADAAPFLAKLEGTMKGTPAPAEAHGWLGRTCLALRAHRASGDSIAVFFRDVTVERRAEEERRRSAARIAHMATHDALTGLPNRTLLKDRLRQALAGEGTVSLLCLDLDRFKQVNDRLGHGAGDGLLKAVAQRLTHAVRGGDTVARMGGDEFVVLLAPDGPAGSEAGAEIACAIAARIIRTLSAPYMLDGERIEIGASVGLTRGAARADLDTLIEEADVALYQAKRAGRGRYVMFRPEMLAEQQRRADLAEALRRGLDAGEMLLHYQPILRLGSRDLWGYEALLRWRRPGHGLVTPAAFIDVAEDTALIEPLGNWALGQACRDAAAWADARLRLAVNLSPLQLRQANLVDQVAHALRSSGLQPDRLEMEVTESVFMDGYDTVSETMRGLRAMGIGFAMDDFGTGFSSLASLRSFPFHRVKIDQRFVQAASTSDADRAVVETIATLAKRLGMACTAEGVETEEQLALMVASGCTDAQGYLLGRPAPAEALARRP